METITQLSRTECIREAEQIFEALTEKAVRATNGHLCFSCIWGGSGNSNVNYPCDLSFEKGLAGIIVLPALLTRYAVTKKIKNSAAALTEQLLSDLENIITVCEAVPSFALKIPENISFASGLAGIVFSILAIQKSQVDLPPGAEELIRRTANLILRTDLSRFADAASAADYYCGLPGVLKLFCTEDTLFAMPGAEAFCRGMCDIILARRSCGQDGYMLWDGVNLGRPLSGMAHGQCGNASALYAAAERLNRTDCMDAALNAYRYENNVFDIERCAWPDLRPGKEGTYMAGICSGAPGIGFDMLTKYRSGSLFAENLERAVDACRKTGLLSYDHYCCGNSAVIDFFLEAGRQLHRPELIEEAGSRLLKMRHRTQTGGRYSLLDRLQAPTICYGAPGIGREFLRFAFPEDIPPCVL